MTDTCPSCGTPKVSPESKYCTNCGLNFSETLHSLTNHCLNPKCPRHISNFNFDSKALVCDECGGPTTVGRDC